MKQAAVDAVHAHCKQAAGFTDAVQMQHGATLRNDAMQQLGRLLLAGAGVGMAGRGLLGVLQLAKRNLAPPKPMGGGVVPVEVPVPVGDQPDEEKMAGVSNFIRGDYAKNPSGIPWMIPATVLGGGAAMYGGWKLMDAVLDARRKAELKEDVDSARSDFQQALLAEYDRPVKTPKLAADNSLAGDLERLYRNVKQAGLMDDVLHGGGVATGVYGTAAGVAGLAAAISAYKATRKRREQELLSKAHKIRQRQLWNRQPPPLVMQPVPVAA